MMKVNELTEWADKLFNDSERTNAESMWEKLTQYIDPNQYGNYHGDRPNGGKRTSLLYDSTAPAASNDLASTLHSLVTNDSIKWAKFRFEQDELNNDADAVEWLEEANNVVLNAFSSSNFNTEINKGYKSYVPLGNMALLVEEIDGSSPTFSGLYFKALHLSQLAWSEGPDGQIDTVFRKFRLSAANAVKKWGDRVSEKIQKCAKKDPQRKFDFIFVVLPNKKENIKINEVGLAKPEERPFIKKVIDVEGKEFVEEGGFYEMPIMVVRWDTMPEESYGRGPGHIAYGDIRSLNMVRRDYLEALALTVHPPVMVTNRGIFGDLNLKPKGVTVVRHNTDVTPYQIGTQWPVVLESMRELQQSVKSIFLVDKLIFPPRNQTGEMTATEVVERINQMQKVLGPTFGRLYNELLNPLVRRVFGLMYRKGMLPEVPASIADNAASISIEYVNPLARSQRIEEVQGIQAWAQDLAGLAQLGMTEALDMIDVDGVGKLSAKIRGVPEKAIANDDVVAQKRQQRAQQMQAAQALDAGVKMADIQSKQDKGEPQQ